MFKKILIANRGEIARRIIRTCKRMGIKTVAVYSEADTNALHVAEADEAVYIGPSPADESYLVVENILDAVRQTGAQAVHPAYGFLSENTDFAEALRKEGVAFIGPTPEAIASMGDKIQAKKIAEKAKVSVVPGDDTEIQTPKEAGRIAAKIGYPVMVKAAAGGGGKGMRVVHTKADIEQAYRSARNEAKKSFSDDRVFIEKFIENPRHIEIQIMADKYGKVVCLGERECSIQRHHQKVIEEAPSPYLKEKTRQKMYEQSVSLAKIVGYQSAGTVEFIVDQEQNFFFLEMNTRLQVEHPVTENVTGLDLVELMIRIAWGERLRMSQKDVKITGHSIESRIYAEDPQRGFLPSTGRITEYKEPKHSDKVRVDSGVYAGGEVSIFYDAMISKLITYGKNRTDAIKYMQGALGEYVINGISHNISFLEALMSHPRFAEGRLSTNFIAEEYPDGFSGAELDEDRTKALLSVGLFVFLKDAQRASRITGQLPGRKRQLSTRWVISVGDTSYSVNVRNRQDGYDVIYEEHRFTIYSNWVLGSNLFQGTMDGQQINVKIEHKPGGYMLTHAGVTVKVTVRTPRVAELSVYMPEVDERLSNLTLSAPISGAVVELQVKEGDKVSAGQPLMILEAMKMENILYAEHDLVVDKILVEAGDAVAVNETIIEFAVLPEEAAAEKPAKKKIAKK
jgi:propionyl-CoA carboxylase alpha chain